MSRLLIIILLFLFCGCSDNELYENTNKELYNLRFIKITWFNNNMKEEIYIRMNKGFEVKAYKNELVIWQNISPSKSQIIKKKIYSINGIYRVEYIYLDSITFIGHNQEEMMGKINDPNLRITGRGRSDEKL